MEISGLQIFFHTVAMLVLFVLLLMALNKTNKSPTEWAFIGLNGSVILWIFSLLMDSGNLLEGGSGNLSYHASLITAFAFFVLFDIFPKNKANRQTLNRLITVLIMSFLIVLLRQVLEFQGGSEAYIQNLSSSGGLDNLVGLFVGQFATLLILGGLIRNLIHLRTIENLDLKSRIRTLTIGSVACLVVILALMAFLTRHQFAQYGSFGICAIVSIIISLFYATIYHELSDIKSILLRFILFLATMVISSGVFTVLTLLTLELYENTTVVSLSIFANGALTFSLLYSYLRHIKPRLYQLIFKNYHLSENILDEFVAEVQALQNLEHSLDFTMETMLQSLYRVINFKKGLIITADHFKKIAIRSIGPVPEYLKYPNLGEDRILLRKKLSPKLSSEFSRFIILEKDYSSIFTEGKKTESYHGRVAKFLRKLTQRLKADDYKVIAPLVYNHSVFGYIILGEKKDGFPYYTGDIKLLENAGMAYALALRNNIIFEETRRLKDEAQKNLENITGPPANEEAWPEPTTKQALDKILIFANPKIKRITERVGNIAALEQAVLIRGETGTGKEVIARLVHQESPRASEPFVEVNCAAIPTTLWESEIFGHEKGAFTDAATSHTGLVEQAAGGTLFFDEIGEMPVDIQPKLLRLIQEKNFKRVGGDTLESARCRLVFATNRDLSTMIKTGEFREDLYYRINVFEIEIPPLRDRGDDVKVLSAHFLEKYSRELNMEEPALDEAAVEALASYQWSGNVRELENTILKTLADLKGNLIHVSDLPDNLRINYTGKSSSTDTYKNGGDYSSREMDMEFLTEVGLEKMTANFSRELIVYALRKCSGNKTHTAEMLRISRGKLQYQMKELGIKNF